MIRSTSSGQIAPQALARRTSEDDQNVRVIERAATQWIKEPRPWGFWVLDPPGRVIRITEGSVQPTNP